eukprot:tig00020902_g15033.t1
MISLLRNLLPNREDRLVFGAIVVIAANAGGAWTCIGDVTTTMLWIGNQVTVTGPMKGLLIPSLISLIVTLLAQTPFIHGTVAGPKRSDEEDLEHEVELEGGREKGGRGHSGALGLSPDLAFAKDDIAIRRPEPRGKQGAESPASVHEDADEGTTPRGHYAPVAAAPEVGPLRTPTLASWPGPPRTPSTGRTLAGLPAEEKAQLEAHGRLVLAVGIGALLFVPILKAHEKQGRHNLRMPHALSRIDITSILFFLGILLASVKSTVPSGFSSNFFWYMKRIAPVALVGYLAGFAWFIVQMKIPGWVA